MKEEPLTVSELMETTEMKSGECLQAFGRVAERSVRGPPREGTSLATLSKNTSHLVGRQSLANKNMDSPEAQPYPL